MSSDNIKYVLDLTKEKKFEIICAGFDLVDAIFKIDVPTEFSDRKIAVQAIQLLGGGYIKYGYDLSRAAREEAARNANVEKSGDSPPVVDVTAGVVEANPGSPSSIAPLADEEVTVADEEVTVADEEVTDNNVVGESESVADESGALVP